MEWNFLPYFNLFVREGLFVHSSQQREERTVRAAVFINPSVTSCHLPYILRCKTQGRWVILTLRSLQCDTPAYGARQGRSLEVALYSFAMNKSFLIQPPRPAGTPPIFPYGNTGGEDWKRHFMFWHKDSFVHFSSIVARHPAMPRDTAGRRVKESIWTTFWRFLFASWGSPYIPPCRNGTYRKSFSLYTDL